MNRKPPSSPRDLIDLVLRRKWWILVPLTVIPVLVLGVSLRMPKRYHSETVILVDPQKIPTEYVKATVTGDVADRLQNISEEVMSRTRLQRIADELGLYNEMRGKMSPEQLISTMRKDITVDLIRGTNERNPVGGFKIGYTASRPDLAQKVTQEIANLFIEENLKARGLQASGTNEFIQTEMQKAKTALSVQEEKIRAFKAAHLGSLPEQEASNLALIGQVQSMAEANSQAIDRATQQRVYLQSMLNMNGGDKGGVPGVATQAQIDLQTKRSELSTAKQKYTDSHPDVVRLRNEVATLEEEVRTQPKDAPAFVPSSGTNTAQQFQSQLASIQEEIKSRMMRQAQLEGQIRALQGRVEVLPAVQSQYAELSRDYEALQKNYQSLVEKEQSSGMAAELEHHDESERFRILDPAGKPSSPSSPNMLLINGGGLVFALIVGAFLAFIVDMFDPTIHNPDEFERYLNIPLIVTIPALASGTKKKARQLKIAG
jgi:succinoglycan biosynthesis transport protein ExoP